jgi:hypothetical protein
MISSEMKFRATAEEGVTYRAYRDAPIRAASVPPVQSCEIPAKTPAKSPSTHIFAPARSIIHPLQGKRNSFPRIIEIFFHIRQTAASGVFSEVSSIRAKERCPWDE